MSDQTITLLILAGSVVLFVWNRFPVGIVALAVAVSLWSTGVLTVDQMVEGFGSPTVVLIAALFVVAEALDAAGVTAWAGQQVVAHAGNSKARLLVLVMLTVAVLSALITPNGSVAALYPLVVVLAVRLRHQPSKLLMPLAFAAHAGALLVLTGSPVTLIASEVAYEAGGHRLGYFEVALAGVPLLIGTIVIVVLFGDRLLPARKPASLVRDLSALPTTLVEHYIHEGNLVRLEVLPDSPLIGRMPHDLDLRAYPELHLISVQDRQGRPMLDEVIAPGFFLTARSDVESALKLADRGGLKVVTDLDPGSLETGLVSQEYGVAEVIISPRSDFVGHTVYPGIVTENGEIVVLAVQRLGKDLGNKPIKLIAGDALLLQGPWSALDEYIRDPNVVVVDTPDAIRRQTVPLGPRAKPALAILAGMVVVLTTGLVPAVVACLVAAILMVLLQVVSVEEAHRSMNWTTLILVAAMIPLSTAISETGAAESIAGEIVKGVGGGSPYLVLLALFLVTAILGQMISNTATALVIFPIAVSVAVEMGVSPMALIMCVNVSAAASLLTPVATPANLMVMGPGGYKFGDYWKLGLPLMALYGAVAVLLVPVFWPL